MPLTALRVLPWKLIGFGVILVAVGVAQYERGEDAERARWKAKQAEAAEASRETEAKYRAESERRYAAQQEAINARERELEAARRDADAAVDAGRRLRAQINSLTAACRAASHPGVAAGGAPADPAADLLADVQRRLDEAAEGIARHADEARAAGLTCERSYDALGKENR